MSDNLNIRLNYLGGKKAEDRMITDKLRTLKKALLYSYQAATAVLEDGREFRCLINPDKLKNDYDNKILSIPYYDICLNSEFLDIPTSLAEEPTNLHVGDIFTWKETGTDWLIYLQYLEEDAYFRAEIRQCGGIVDINGHQYKAYIRGPVETTIKWNQKKGINWNTINYSKVAYIKEDDITANLKRFDIVKVDGKNFEVQVVNRDTASNGIMVVYLSEYYTNSIEEQFKEAEPEIGEKPVAAIQGEIIVNPYERYTYTIESDGGEWTVSNKKARIIKSTDTAVLLEIVSGRSGEVDLVYTYFNGKQEKLTIEIQSF